MVDKISLANPGTPADCSSDDQLNGPNIDVLAAPIHNSDMSTAFDLDGNGTGDDRDHLY